ncbi:MAG: hypothetical protein R2747_09795 [Pyrinomonadaceae bacterium]
MYQQYEPCPKCGAFDAEPMSFTWWGGLLGPKILTHVKCPNCRATYNGKTGRDNTTGIVIYVTVVGLVTTVLCAFLIFLVTFSMMN